MPSSEWVTAIISTECQIAAIVAGTIDTATSFNLLDKRSPRIGAIILKYGMDGKEKEE